MPLSEVRRNNNLVKGEAHGYSEDIARYIGVLLVDKVRLAVLHELGALG